MNRTRILCLLCCVLGLSLPASASEHGAEPPAAEAGNGAPATDLLTGGPPPWTEVQTRMLVYKGQRQQLMGEMAKIRAEQRHLKMGTMLMKQKGAELVKLHKEYKELTEEYNKLLAILRYRFPERMAKEVLKVNKPEEVPDLEEFEHQMDLDARLKKTIEKARGQYGSEDAPIEGNRKPSSVEAPMDESEKTIREDAPILMRK